MSVILFFAVSFMASIAGAICGIGGGVIIKPVLDMLQMGAPATINFLSGCTVLSMSLYSVSKALRAGDSKVDMSIGTPLALGAALGGIAGKELFSAVKTAFGGSPMVGGVQAVALGMITLGTLLYTLNKHRIPTKNVCNPVACVLIGLALMVCGGIDGGIVGRKLNKKLTSRAVDKLFIALMVAIVGICIYNSWKAF